MSTSFIPTRVRVGGLGVVCYGERFERVPEIVTMSVQSALSGGKCVVATGAAAGLGALFPDLLNHTRTMAALEEDLPDGGVVLVATVGGAIQRGFRSTQERVHAPYNDTVHIVEYIILHPGRRRLHQESALRPVVGELDKVEELMRGCRLTVFVDTRADEECACSRAPIHSNFSERDARERSGGDVDVDAAVAAPQCGVRTIFVSVVRIHEMGRGNPECPFRGLRQFPQHRVCPAHTWGWWLKAGWCWRSWLSQESGR